MKNTIKIIIIALISINASCQVTTIVPYKTVEYPNGAYIKDTNNEFTFWIDTWEGISNNKKYTFILFQQNLIYFSNNAYHYRDEVVAKLKVFDLLTNQTIYDESSYTNYDDYKINGIIIRDSEFLFGLYDKEVYCYNRARFSFVKNITNPNQIVYKNFEYGFYNYFDCTYPDQLSIPMFLPTEEFILTRQ